MGHGWHLSRASREEVNVSVIDLRWQQWDPSVNELLHALLSVSLTNVDWGISYVCYAQPLAPSTLCIGSIHTGVK